MPLLVTRLFHCVVADSPLPAQSRHLATNDHKALAYILNHADSYPKPPQMRQGFQAILGNGKLIEPISISRIFWTHPVPSY